ncbi:MAG: pitrilysin family protein [candidate division WOR-3 bacterium]
MKILFLIFSFTQIFYLKNGVPVIYKKIEGINCASVAIFFNYGSLKYEKGMDGIEYFSLNAICEGTMKNPYPEFEKILIKEGIQKKIIATHDFSAIIFKSPLKSFKKSIELLYEVLSKPELKKERVEVVRNFLISKAKRKLEEPDEKLFTLLDSIFYFNHPYDFEPEGKINTLKKFKIEDIKKFLENNFHANGIIIGIASPLDKEEILPFLNDSFGKISGKELNLRELKDFIPRDTLFHFKEPNYKTSYIACKFPIPSIEDRDFIYVLALLEILSNRFEEKVRIKEGLSYSVYAGFPFKRKNYGYFYVSSSYPDSAWKLMMEEVERIKNEEVSNKEIKGVLNIFKTYRFLRNAATDLTILNSLISYILTQNPDYIDSLILNIEKIDKEKIKEVANRYLKNFTVLKITP